MIRMILVAIWVVGFLLLSLPVALVETILAKKHPDKRDRIAYHMIRFAFRGILFLSGVKVELKGAENLPGPGEAVLYASNHRSYFDIIAAYTIVPDLTGFVAKIETNKVPIFRLWMRYIHCLFLDRKDMRAGMQMVLDGVNQIKSGISVWICPEGTRNKSADCTDLLEFHAASLKMAEKSQSKIVPVAISGSSEVWEQHLPWIRSSKIIMQIGTPIETADLDREGKKNLCDSLKNQIHDMLVEQKAERDTWKNQRGKK